MPCDPTTGVYWASDAFATPMLTPITDVADLPADVWQEGVPMFAQYVSPWLELVADGKFQRTVDRVAALRPTAIAGCHTPGIHGEQIRRVLDMTRWAPRAAVPPQPDQSVLEEIERTLLQPARA
jgi:hypothetical protein